MWSLPLWLTLLSVVAAKTDFPNEVVITSADVVNQAIPAFGKGGESYRIYACAHADYNDDFLASQIIITDSTGKNFRLVDLRKPVTPGSIFLSDKNTVVGPVTVRDPTPVTQVKSGFPSNFPYTIYLVSSKVEPIPVAAAMAMTTNPIPRLDSDAINKQGVRGVTFLNADALLTLRQFNFTTDSAYIIPRGYDVQSSGTKDSVIDLNQQNAYLSYLTIYGPIATILSTDQSKTGRFQFGYNQLVSFDALQSGSALTLLSPNWLSLDASYNTPYSSYTEAFDRQFNYGVDTLLNFEMSASNLKDAESVSLEIKDQMGGKKTWKYDSSSKGQVRDGAYGLYLNLKVNVTSLTETASYPRFMIKVTAGAADNAYLLPLILILMFINRRT